MRCKNGTGRVWEYDGKTITFIDGNDSTEIDLKEANETLSIISTKEYREHISKVVHDTIKDYYMNLNDDIIDEITDNGKRYKKNGYFIIDEYFQNEYDNVGNITEDNIETNLNKNSIYKLFYEYIKKDEYLSKYSTATIFANTNEDFFNYFIVFPFEKDKIENKDIGKFIEDVIAQYKRFEGDDDCINGRCKCLKCLGYIPEDEELPFDITLFEKD